MLTNQLNDDAKYAIISCSGGLDSTSLLLHMLAQDLRVKIINFNYGSQQNKYELKCLKRNLKYLASKGYEVDYQEIDISKAMNSFKSSLTRKDIDNPTGEYTRENQKIIFVPNRNTIFANIIFGHALTLYQDTGDGVVVGLGIHKSDNQDNSTYPDCTPEWAESVFNTFKIGNFENKVSMYNPYEDKYKKDVLEDGIKCCKILGLSWKRIYKNTLSCYNPNEKGEACGKCPTGVERLKIFNELKKEDPSAYMSK